MIPSVPRRSPSSISSKCLQLSKNATSERSALWCFHRTETFEAAILEAANLGDDADTTAAITGQIAGAYYGSGGIPKRWLEKVHLRIGIEEMAGELLRLAGSADPKRDL